MQLLETIPHVIDYIHVVCREKAQLSVLMALVKGSVGKPLQRLPTLTAVFLAEASCALTQPGCQLFPAINRHLLRRPALDLEVKAPLPILTCRHTSKRSLGP